MTMADNARQLPKFDLGGCLITLIDGGRLKLDGGAMFGIIPKPLWQRSTPADEQNRIQLACNCLLVEWSGETARRVIIETGHGPKYDAKEQGFFDIDPSHWLLSGLRTAGVEPETITDVVVSHLHFDHAGGLTHERDGRLVPTFPNAKVHAQRREYEDARASFSTMKATYREENLGPIHQANRWCLHEGEEECLPGVRPLLTPGHTRGHQSVIVTGTDRTAVFPGDSMPTAAHVGAPYNMAYDLFPLDNRESKNKYLKRAAQEDWLIFIDHEVETPVMRARVEKSWYTLRPA
ncbi:MAG: MBL fold metallo-hydrolase [Planctomycetes bacterium]|nr:MBL fold metallo-hydrolase [Planctomycetota bacterium]